MTLLNFLQESLGHRLTNPGGLGGQCVDATNEYLRQVWGVPAVRANAVDQAKVAIPGFTWVANGPSNYPPYGAIVVWGAAPSVGVGEFGHIAIAIRSNPVILLTVDQNWPDGAPLSSVIHDYRGVLGWHAPKAPLAA